MELGPDFCYALAARRHARHVSRLYDDHLAPAGLSISQFSILTILHEVGPLRTSELAEAMVMERTSLVRAVQPLRRSGLVVKNAKRREHILSLSVKGEKKVEATLPLWVEAQAAFEDRIGRARAKRLREDGRRAVLA